MKKKFLFGMALGCSALLLVGCGAEKIEDEEEKESKPKTQMLVCTQSEEEEGMETTLEMSFVYNNSKKEITDGNMKVTIDVGKENIDLFKDMNLCDEYEGQDMFSSCKSIKEGTLVGADLSLDLEKLEEEAESEMDFSRKMTLKELQKSINSDGEDYDCKIK